MLPARLISTPKEVLSTLQGYALYINGVLQANQDKLSFCETRELNRSSLQSTKGKRLREGNVTSMIQPNGLFTKHDYADFDTMNKLITRLTSGYMLYNHTGFINSTGIIHATVIDNLDLTRHKGNPNVYKVLRLYYVDKGFNYVKDDNNNYAGDAYPVLIFDIGIHHEMLPLPILQIFNHCEDYLTAYTKEKIPKYKTKRKESKNPLNTFLNKGKSNISKVNESDINFKGLTDYKYTDLKTYNEFTGLDVSYLDKFLGTPFHIYGEQDHPVYKTMIENLMKYYVYLDGDFTNSNTNGVLNHKDDVFGYRHLVLTMLLSKYCDYETYYFIKSGNDTSTYLSTSDVGVSDSNNVNVLCTVNNYHRIQAYLKTCTDGLYDFEGNNIPMLEQFLYPQIKGYGRYTSYAFIYLNNREGLTIPSDLKSHMVDNSLTFAFKGMSIESAHGYIEAKFSNTGSKLKNTDYKGSLQF